MIAAYYEDGTPEQIFENPQRVRYNGAEFDPADSDNSTAIKLIKHASSKMEYVGYQFEQEATAK